MPFPIGTGEPSLSLTRSVGARRQSRAGGAARRPAAQGGHRVLRRPLQPATAADLEMQVVARAGTRAADPAQTLPGIDPSPARHA